MKINIPASFDLPPVPAGWYRATPISYKVDESSAGNPMITWTIRLDSQGPDPTVPTIGRNVFDHSVIVEKALFRLDALLKATSGKGLPAGDMEVEDIITLATSRILNQPIMIRIAHREDDGTIREDIKSVKSISQGVPVA